MKFYEVVADSVGVQVLKEVGYRYWLVSYYYIRDKSVYNGVLGTKKEVDELELFLDSGAYTAWSKGKEIVVDEYCKFIEKHIDYIDVYANLDDISDYKQTIANQRLMERRGFKPLPVYHLNEPISLLIDYCSEYDYVCIGGLVGIRRKAYDRLKDIYQNVDQVWKTKIHLFGVGSWYTMLTFPFESSDSSGSRMSVSMGLAAGKHYSEMIRCKSIDGEKIGKCIVNNVNWSSVTKELYKIEIMRRVKMVERINRYWQRKLDSKIV